MQARGLRTDSKIRHSGRSGLCFYIALSDIPDGARSVSTIEFYRICIATKTTTEGSEIPSVAAVYREKRRSDGGFDVPNESTYSDFGIAQVNLLDGFEQLFYFVVFDYGEDCRVHFWPSVCTTVRITGAGATPLYFFEEGETPYIQRIEHVFDTLRVGLVENYQYTFHTALFIRIVCINGLRRLRLLVVHLDLHEDELLTQFAFLVTLTPTAECAIEDRHDEEGEEGGDGETTDYHNTHRYPHFGAFAFGERHRQHTQDSGEGRHEDGSDTASS